MCTPAKVQMEVKSFGEVVLKCEVQLMFWGLTFQYISRPYHHFLLDLITFIYLFTSEISFRNMHQYNHFLFIIATTSYILLLL